MHGTSPFEQPRIFQTNNDLLMMEAGTLHEVGEKSEANPGRPGRISYVAPTIHVSSALF